MLSQIKLLNFLSSGHRSVAVSVSKEVNARRSLELRQVRYFVTLAEELNFRRAAERLFITQPSLSHQIALMEACVGVRLFRRDRRQVALTDAGKALLKDARQLLAESDALVMKARHLGADESAILNVGFPEFLNRTLIPDIAPLFGRRHPEAKLMPTEGYSRTLLRELQRGRLDVAFMMIPPAEDPGDLQLEVMIDEKPGLMLAANHRLAGRSEVRVGDLVGEKILLADRSVNPAVYDLVAEWLEQAGVQPDFFNVGGSGAYTYQTAMRVVMSGEAVSLVAPSMLSHLPQGLVFRPIHGPAPHFRVAAVWSRTNTSPLLSEFLDAARELRVAKPSVLAISS